MKTPIKILTIATALYANLTIAKQQPNIEQESPPKKQRTTCIAAASQWLCGTESELPKLRQQAEAIAAQQTKEVEITTIETTPQWKTPEPKPKTQSPTPQAKSQMHNTIEPSDQLLTTQPPVKPTVKNEPLHSSSQPTLKSTPPTTKSKQHAIQGFHEWQQLYPKKWSLQVVATTEIQKLKAFIIQNDLLEEQFTITTTTVNNIPWHIVLIGLFDDFQAAVTYRQQLPPPLNQTAWPRPIAKIKSD